MKLSYINTYVKALLDVEAEGFFVERLINLCKINNIKIWDIVYVNTGKITFKMASKDYKKLKPYIKKSKCKVKIKSKRGIYFDLFRYRKRRLFIYLVAFLLMLFFVASNFVWKIEVIGNKIVSTDTINELIKSSGIHVGQLKFFIKKGRISDYIRANLYEASWVGVDIKGTTLTISIKEKIISKEEDKTVPGNIVATKSAVITKIIAENGTAVFKTGSYINKGDVAIKGVIESDYLETEYVHASGILKGIIEYKFEKAYKYNEKIKEYTGKTKYGLGIKINNKEFIIKYLPKEFKYDINNKVKKINVFGINFSGFFNIYSEYIDKDILNTKDTLIIKGEQDLNLFISTMLNKESKVQNKDVEVIETKDGIIYKVTLSVEEDIGKFVKTGDK